LSALQEIKHIDKCYLINNNTIESEKEREGAGMLAARLAGGY
jgi:hypothetical protein